MRMVPTVGLNVPSDWNNRLNIMDELAKERYYQFVYDNDKYPKHSHQWIVTTYTTNPFKTDGGRNHAFYRNFGPFDSKDDAKSWIDAYKAKYTKRGFITKYEVLGLCEALE